MARTVDYRNKMTIPKVRSFTESVNSREKLTDEMINDTINEIKRTLKPNRPARKSYHDEENSEFNIPMTESDLEYSPEKESKPEAVVGSDIKWEPCKVDSEVRPDKIFSQTEARWNPPPELGPSSEENSYIDQLNAVFNTHKVCINLNKSCCENLNKFYNG